MPPVQRARGAKPVQARGGARQIVFVFGLPGAGKNYVVDLLARTRGFHAHDGDDEIDAEMHAHIRRGDIIPDRLREGHYARIIANVRQLARQHPRIAVCQAMSREAMRQKLRAAFPQAVFLRVVAPPAVREARLHRRSHFVSPAYARKIEAMYEFVRIPHRDIVNDGDDAKLLRQLRKALGR